MMAVGRSGAIRLACRLRSELDTGSWILGGPQPGSNPTGFQHPASSLDSALADLLRAAADRAEAEDHLENDGSLGQLREQVQALVSVWTGEKTRQSATF